MIVYERNSGSGRGALIAPQQLSWILSRPAVLLKVGQRLRARKKVMGGKRSLIVDTLGAGCEHQCCKRAGS